MIRISFHIHHFLCLLLLIKAHIFPDKIEPRIYLERFLCSLCKGHQYGHTIPKVPSSPNFPPSPTISLHSNRPSLESYSLQTIILYNQDRK